LTSLIPPMPTSFVCPPKLQSAFLIPVFELAFSFFSIISIYSLFLFERMKKPPLRVPRENRHFSSLGGDGLVILESWFFLLLFTSLFFTLPFFRRIEAQFALGISRLSHNGFFLTV